MCLDLCVLLNANCNCLSVSVSLCAWYIPERERGCLSLSLSCLCFYVAYFDGSTHVESILNCGFGFDLPDLVRVVDGAKKEASY